MLPAGKSARGARKNEVTLIDPSFLRLLVEGVTAEALLVDCDNTSSRVASQVWSRVTGLRWAVGPTYMIEPRAVVDPPGARAREARLLAF